MKRNIEKHIFLIALLFAITVSTASAQQQENSQSKSQELSRSRSTSGTQHCATISSFGIQLQVCWDRENNKNMYGIKISTKQSGAETNRR